MGRRRRCPPSESRWVVETGGCPCVYTGPGAAVLNPFCSKDGRVIPLQVKALLEVVSVYR